MDWFVAYVALHLYFFEEIMDEDNKNVGEWKPVSYILSDF